VALQKEGGGVAEGVLFEANDGLSRGCESRTLRRCLV
jgi:hypothetical protein